MGNRYIYHGAAFNGDGTSPDQATVAGGVGAWNDIKYLQSAANPPPAGSTLPAGTSVYTRTKDAAGADITVTLTAAVAIGSAAATEAEPIDWYFDDGVVWPGVQGVVTYTCSGATNYQTTATTFNNFYTGNYNLVFESLVTAHSAVINLVLWYRCNTRKVKVSMPSLNASAVGYPRLSFINNSTHEDLWVVSISRVAGAFIAAAIQTCVTLINPKIELISSPSKNGPVFTVGFSGASTMFLVYGGEVYGSGATTDVSLAAFAAPGGTFMSYGLKFPQTMDLAPLGSFSGSVMSSIASAAGCDGKMGHQFSDYFCNLAARYDGYYPTLNAKLSDSSGTPWSYALYPYRTSGINPARVAVSKTYTQAAAVKTITQELLWPNSMAAPTSDQVWLTVLYTDDTTGQQVSLTTKTQTAAALPTSTANWSASTYGPTNFSKRKISVDTPTAIRQDTDVLVLLWSAPVAASASDIIIICPDPVLT